MITNMHILVVEDHVLVRGVVEIGLGEAGYSVSVAATAEEAFDLLDVVGNRFAALVTDVNLAPGMGTGWDVARRARELGGDLPVVYMTAESSGEWTSQGVPNSVLITKPLTIGQMVTALSQLLSANRGDHPPLSDETPFNEI